MFISMSSPEAVQPSTPPKPAPKRGRKPKAEAAPVVTVTPSEGAPRATAPTPVPSRAPKAPGKKAPPKPNPKQVFLENLLELHCMLVETVQMIDQTWGKQLAKIAPYDDGGDEGGDEDPMDED